jgi:Zn-dependent protease with chaperone function
MMGFILFILTLAIEGASVAFSYWYGVHIFGPALAALWDVLFPQQPVSVTACGLILVTFNLSLHLIVLMVAAIRLTWAWLRMGVPSERQAAAVTQIYDQVIMASAPYPSRHLKMPRGFRFSPDPSFDLGWIGRHLVIRDTLLKSRFLSPLLTHELAHYNSADLWLRLLLELLPPPLYGLLVVFGLGIGLGPLVTYLLWIWYWRNREYAADAFVAGLGQSESLIEALEHVILPRDRERNILLRAVPYTEERINRLRQLHAAPLQVVAPRSNVIAALPAGPDLPTVPDLSPVVVAAGIPEEIEGDLTLGTALQGDLWEWVKAGCVVYPRWALGLHGVVIGRSGAGKTETLLRIAYLAAKIYRYQVIYLDAKGDWNLAARFCRLMQAAGIAEQRIGLFPNVSHNGWLGDEHDLLNKLLQSQQWNDHFYREVAVNLLSLALNAPGGLPKNSAELLDRLNPNRLQAIYKGKPQEQELKGLDTEKQWGAYLRYSAFFRAVRGKLDGTASFGSYDAAYYLLDGVRLKDEAGRLGQYLIEDFEQYLAQRRYSSINRDKRTLIIIDDYSAISSAARAVDLFERIRGLHGCVLISAQSEEGLGLYADTRRIMGTAPTLILHATVFPKDSVEAAGMILTPQFTYHLPEDEHAAHPQEPQLSLIMRRDFRVQPSDVQHLPAGRVYVIHGGRAQLTEIAMLPYDEDEVEARASDLQRQYVTAQQSASSSPPPARPQKKQSKPRSPRPNEPAQ